MISLKLLCAMLFFAAVIGISVIDAESPMGDLRPVQYAVAR